jgi:hypothetical protein
MLLTAGAHVDAQDIFGNTPLHFAVTYKRVELIKMLIAAGASLKALNVGCTPWDLAVPDIRKRIPELQP